MKVLSIETSCDETAIAILEAEGGLENLRFSVLAHELYSQAVKHARYGGVYPNLAKRLHGQNLVPLLKETLREAGLLRVKQQTTQAKENYSNVRANIGIVLEKEQELLEQFEEFVPTVEKPTIGAIAVTRGPGLEPALWVGVNFAKALALVWNLPIVPVNHMEGHIASVLWHGSDESGIKNQESRNKIPRSKLTKYFIFENRRFSTAFGLLSSAENRTRFPDPLRSCAFLPTASCGEECTSIKFPAIALLISGGHTELVLAKEWGKYELLGQTRDDAVGEAFDKVARILGLPYPGGPEISRLAETARREEFRIKNQESRIRLPRPMIDSPDYDFSFAGLKTAVLYAVKKRGNLDTTTRQEIAREFEDAVADVLITKTKRALRAYQPKTLIVAGGVIANKRLRESFEKFIREFPETTLRIPHHDVTGDNAVMIGIAGYLNILTHRESVNHRTLRARGNLRLVSRE